MKKLFRAIGLMSGTVLDGEIDVALIETDGGDYVRALGYMSYPYGDELREKVRKSFGKKQADVQTREAEEIVTDLHIEAVKLFGEKADVIGFHGQTITHDPDNGFTWQIGDGKRLAQATGIDVVYDMRKADILSGGQGAPLLPLYHRALLAEHEKPVAVLNIGGVANLTYIGGRSLDTVIAFDTGPGNALMDDFMRLRRGKAYDAGGAFASRGAVQTHMVQKFLEHDYFSLMPPKSLDRNMWSSNYVRNLGDEDGMATLLDITARCVAAGVEKLPKVPEHLYVAGGGRRNLFLMDVLGDYLPMPIDPVEELGWNGDATEAEGFAYLAVRSLLGEVLSLPGTTGVGKDLSGGVFARGGM